MGQLSERLAALSPQQKSQLFKKLEKKRDDTDRRRILPRERNGESFRLSFAQQRLWFLQWLEPSNVAYNLSIPLRLNGALQVSALERSLNEIARRHEALRTSFPEVNGQPVQVIAPETDFDLRAIDLTNLPREAREEELQRLAQEEARRPFSLTTGPLVSAHLYRVDDDDSLFLTMMHHIISDGWSMGVFVRELIELYKAFTEGRTPVLSELPIQYADFAEWQRQWLGDEVLERLLSYWRRELDGAPTLELPTDFPRPVVSTQAGAIEESAFSAADTEGLRGLVEDVTLSMAVMSVFAVLLHYLSQSDDIVVGCNVANRNRVETEGLIGFFVNHLPLRIRLDAHTTFRKLLRQVQRVMLAAFEHQDLPFQSIVDALHLERDVNRNPLFQVMFAFQNTPMPPISLPGLRVSGFDLDNGTTAFDFALLVSENGDGLITVLRYSTELFHAATARRMLEQLSFLAHEVVADPKTTIERLCDKLSHDDRWRREIKIKQRKTSNIRQLDEIARRRVRSAPTEHIS